jgi:hypothetical protein
MHIRNARESRLLRAALERIDANYRERKQLLAVGPLLYLGVVRHAGEACALPDGTRIEPGAWVGRLHFNNARAAAVEAETRPQAGIRFARLLRDSFAELALRARDDTRLRQVHLFEGVTWLRAHGRGVGFDAQPLPHGPRRWLMSAHFRLLIWAFAPVATRAAMGDVRPHHFRISRQALQASFGALRAGNRTGDVTPDACIDDAAPGSVARGT